MKNSPSILRELSRRVTKNSRGRTAVASLAVILTTLLFTTLFVLAQSMSKNLLQMTFQQSGYTAHASFKSISGEQIQRIAAHPEVESYGTSMVLGVAKNKSLSGRQVEIRYASDQYAQNTFSMPSTGHMPENPGEIALDSIVLERLGIPAQLGQAVTLEWSAGIQSSEVNTSTFTLCGYWEGNTAVYASMAWVSEEFVLDACQNAPSSGEDQILGLRMMQVNLQSDGNIDKTMEKILEDTGLTGLEYGSNLAYSPEMKGIAAQESLPMYLGMALVFVSGYLIIYNVFQISVHTDIQFYGKLKTLGTTNRQLRRLIYSQANLISLIGIPIGLIVGYLLGAGLVPMLIVRKGASPAVSFHPVIFIGSALFAWITVLVSCLRPARIAGKVSPMEALRYTDGGGIKRKQKKRGLREYGASLVQMAWANLGRNRKRTATVVVSLTLGLVLLSCFYAYNASFDINKYLESLALSDFQVDDSTSGSFDGYDPDNKTLTPQLVEQIQNLEGLEDTGLLYTHETTIPLSRQAVENTRNFYEKQDRLQSMEYDTAWTQGYHQAVEEGQCGAEIYGADGLALDAATDLKRLADGAFHLDEFLAGDTILALGPPVESEETMPTFSVGETIELEGRTFTVGAVFRPYGPITSGTGKYGYSVSLVLPSSVFTQLYPEYTPRKVFFNVSDGSREAAAAFLSDYQKNVDSSMPVTSRFQIIEQYQEETRASGIMGNAISVVIAMVGVLNFINSMVTAILSRKKEFAMLQSVGMTKSQVRGLLMMEGLGYTLLSLMSAYLISTLAVGVVIRSMVEGGYTTFRFTLAPLLLCTPFLLAFAVLVPWLCFHNLEKQSVVERLRMAE